MLLNPQKLPTYCYLFYNIFDANDTANDCRKIVPKHILQFGYSCFTLVLELIFFEAFNGKHQRN